MRNERKLNLPFVAGLLTVPFVVAGLVHLLHHFQMVRNASTYLRQAKRAQEENTFESKSKAVMYLERYVQLAPNDPEGFVRLGLQYADVNRFYRATIMLERGLAYLPDRSEVRRRLVDCLMQLTRFNDASEHLQNYLLKASPDDGELLEKLAVCQSSRQEFEAAEKTFQSAIKNSPERLGSYVLLASLRQEKLSRSKEAITTVNEMVSSNAENPKAYLLRGQWYLRQFTESKNPTIKNRLDRAEAEKFLQEAELDANQALERDPGNADALMFVSRVKLALGKHDETRQYLFKGIELHPDRVGFFSMLSNLETETGNSVEAIDVMRKGAAAAPKNLELQWNLARLLIESDATQEAKEIINRLRGTKYPPVAIEFLEARILFRRNEWLPLIQKLESQRGRIALTPENLPLFRLAEYMLGVAYREINSNEKQIASFRRALALDPEWMQAKLALAESLAASDQNQEAASEYAEISLLPNAPASALLGSAKSLVQLNRNKPLPLQDWVEFDRVIAKLEELSPQSPQVTILQMQKLSLSNEPDRAAKLIRTAREKNPDAFELWLTEFELAKSRRDTDAITRLPQEAEIQFGDTVNIRMMKANSIISQLRSPDDANNAKAELLKLSEPVATWTEPQKIQLAETFASLFLSIEDCDNAERLALLTEKAQPKNLRIQSMLLEIGRRSKHVDQMERALQVMKAVEGEGPDWHFGQAQRLVLIAQEQKDANALSEAISHLEQAKALRPTYSQYAVLAAKILDVQGDQVAISKYLEAIRLGEKSPAVTNRVLTLLVNSQKFEEASKLIAELHESRSPFTEEMARNEVVVWIQLGRKDLALKAVEQLVRDFQGGTDPKWLARAYLSLDKNELAEAQFRACIAANPGDSEVWIGLVQTLTRLKQTEKIEKAIEEAKLAIPEDKSVLTIAQCYEIAGKLALADESYRKAIESSPDNPFLRRKRIEFQLAGNNFREAEVALRKMLELSNGTDEAAQNNRKWANRNLAICLLAMGGRENLNEALKIADQIIQTNGTNTPDELRLKASILAKWPSRVERQQAIAIFEKLTLDEKVVTAEDRWQLANLYQLEGDLKKSRAELLKAIFLRKDDPRFYALYISLSIKADELSNAELYIDALQKLLPSDWATADLQSQLLYAREKFPEIVSLLKKFVNTGVVAKEKPESIQLRKELVGRQFESFAVKLSQEKQTAIADQFFTEAETLFNQIAKDNPAEIIMLAEFLAGTKQIDRALDLLREHGPQAGVNRINRIVRKISRNPDVTKDQLAQLQEYVTKFQALVADKSLSDPSKSIVLTLADLMSWRGDAKGAQKIYSDVLNENPNNIYALNNMAVSLALNSGDNRQAMRLVDQAIKCGGPLDSLLDTRGMIHLAAGHSEPAMQDFKQAVFEKETAENQFHLAIALSRSRQFGPAKAALENAEKLGLLEQELHPKERADLKKLRSQLATQ